MIALINEPEIRRLKKVPYTLRPNNLGLVIMIIGIAFIFLGAQINAFTKTDVNYSFFGGVLVIFGLLLWITKSGRRRR